MSRTTTSSAQATAAIVAAGQLHARDLDELDRATRVIAADGGAAVLEAAGRRPDVVVGDLDSVAPDVIVRAGEQGVAVERHPVDKDASDTELALRHAASTGARQVVILAATGGERLDHALANVLLLASRAHAGLDLRIVAGDDTVRLVRGGERVTLGPPGGIVSLLPIGDAHGITTDGLRWPLSDGTLPAGSTLGLSNEVIGRPASVSVGEGALLVVERAIR